MPPTAVRRRHLLLGLTLTLGALLAACGAKPAATPTLTVLSVATPTRTPPLSATETARPTFTASATRRSSATPTASLTPTALPTSTRIAPPVAGAAAYRLKPWVLGDGSALLDLLVPWLEDDYLRPLLCCEPQLSYSGAVEANALLSHEIETRDPAHPWGVDLQWHTAWTAAAQGDGTADDWMLAALAAELNQDHLTVADLPTVAARHQLFIKALTDAPNLFGDGAPATIGWLNLSEILDNGLFFVARDKGPGQLELHKLISDWQLDGQGFETFKSVAVVGDQTLDGIPEAVVGFGLFGHNFCDSDLHFFQWQTDHFEDWSRAPAQPNGIHNASCFEQWRYGPPDALGRPTVETAAQMDAEAEIIWRYRYQWTPDGYVQIRASLEPPGAAAAPAPEWRSASWDAGNYVALAERLNAMLAGWQEIHTITLVGPSYRDYVRFQLALIAAFQGQTAEAQTQFQALVEAPVNPTVTVISEAAAAYLAHYAGVPDLYRACDAALAVVEAAQAAYTPPAGYMTSDDYIAVQGYYVGDFDDGLCSRRAALLHLVRLWPRDDLAGLLARIDAAGVIAGDTITADLDQDRRADWVISLRVNNRAGYWEAWVFLNDQAALQAQPLKSWNGRTAAYAQPLQLTVLDLPNTPRPVVVLDAGNYLSFLRVVTALDQPYLVEFGFITPETPHGYAVGVDGDEVVIRVDISTSRCPNCLDIYTWDAGQMGFVKTAEMGRPPTAESLLAQAEALLFDQGDAHAARVRYSDALALSGEGSLAQRILYGSAVAAELDGDPTAAATVFWQLWNEYPDSAYGLLASQRLEPTP